MLRTALAVFVFWLAVFFGLSAAWITFIKATTNPSELGLAGGALLMFVPMIFAGLSLLWLLVRNVLVRFKGPLSFSMAGLFAAGVSIFVTVAICGPKECYEPGPTGHGAGWFWWIGVVLLAIGSEAIVKRLGRKTENV